MKKIKNKKRVVVAMSGGVDSSVAALLLKKKGYEVIGITICFGTARGRDLSSANSKRPTCCGLEAISDARRVCHSLGIKHYVINLGKVLEEKVIKEFSQEYLRGRTPNPCVRCNQYVKFGALLKKARSLDADFLATGHYARITKALNSRTKHQSYLLKRGKDEKKDQAYFLYRITQSQLKHLLFPLGNYTKEQVRSIARENKLSVADKLGSQEICFLPDNDYRQFLRKRVKAKIKPGPIVDTKGNLLGEHQGVAFYTIGQREGLGIAVGHPVYIVRIDKRKNQIVVGSKEEVYSREFLVKRPHYIAKAIKNKVVLDVKIRYNHKKTKAQIVPFKKGLKISFKKPQPAITPGQSAVFYDKDIVIGGGIIENH